MLANITLRHSVLDIDTNDGNLDTLYQEQKVRPY